MKDNLVHINGISFFSCFWFCVFLLSVEKYDYAKQLKQAISELQKVGDP